MQKNWLVPFLAGALVVLVTMGVIYGRTLLTPQEEEPEIHLIQEPFSARWSMAEDFTVEVEGYGRGIQPGEPYETVVSLLNGSQESWEDRYCLFLVDQKDVVLELARQDFRLEAGGQETRMVWANLPQDLMGPYGLVLLIPGRGSFVTTIWVGDGEEGPAGPWPAFDSCP